MWKMARSRGTCPSSVSPTSMVDSAMKLQRVRINLLLFCVAETLGTKSGKAIRCGRRRPAWRSPIVALGEEVEDSDGAACLAIYNRCLQTIRG
jgi:hypothetical protein